jgi:hypothetical protein
MLGTILPLSVRFKGAFEEEDQLLIRFLLWDKYRKNAGNRIYIIHYLFIDFQAAYDNVWRNEIWSEMHKLGFPKKLVNLCRILNNEIYAKVKNGNLSPEFEVMKVLR